MRSPEFRPANPEISRLLLHFHQRRSGFFLFETMIAVAMFATGVIALGYCIQNCLTAEAAKEDDARARRALLNEMTLIEAGAKPLADSSAGGEELKGMFAGMKLKTTRKLIEEKNEKEQPITGIYDVKLELLWTNAGEPQSKELSFYVYPRQR